MKKIATLSALAFVLATVGAFGQTPASQPATGDKTAAPATKTAKTAHHHKKGVKKGGATTPAATPAAK